MNRRCLTFLRSSCLLKTFIVPENSPWLLIPLVPPHAFSCSLHLTSVLWCFRDSHVKRFYFICELNLSWSHLRFLQNFFCRYGLLTELSVYLQLSPVRWEQNHEEELSLHLVSDISPIQTWLPPFCLEEWYLMCFQYQGFLSCSVTPLSCRNNWYSLLTTEI